MLRQYARLTSLADDRATAELEVNS